MQFKEHKFSARFPAVTCALFVIHEPAKYIAGAENNSIIYQGRTAATLYRGTAAAIVLAPNGLYWTGVCLCSPQDQFIKAVGRAKAIGRAFQAMKSNFADDLVTPSTDSYRRLVQAQLPGNVVFDLRTNQWDLVKLKEALRAAIDTMKQEKGIL